MTSIFVSYSRRDQDIARKVVESLETSGYTVSWDERFHIAVGAPLINLLDERCNTATCVLVLWSKSAIESKWVETEASIGMQRRRLLQVTLDGTQPPPVFRNYIYGSLEAWDGTVSHKEFQRIIRGVQFFEERNKGTVDS
jgi:hypothetical protein